MNQKILAVLVAAIIIIVAAGAYVAFSGDSGNDNGGDDGDAEEGYPRTITDATGVEVTLDSKPERVSLLHSVYMDHLLSLGVYPTACAGASTGGIDEVLENNTMYSDYLGGLEGIIDLGSTLNIEAIAESDPDVIITFSTHAAATSMYDQLCQIAPVVLIDFNATYAEQLNMISEVFALEDKAQEVLDGIETSLEELRTLTSGSDLTFAVLKCRSNNIYTIWTEANYETFGLTPGINPIEPGQSLITVDLEGLSGYDPDVIIFFNYHSTVDPWLADQEQFATWNSLTAVKNDQVLVYDDAIQSLGPLAYMQLIENLTGIFESQ